MFGRQSKETQEDEQLETNEPVFSYQTSLETETEPSENAGLMENAIFRKRQDSEKMELADKINEIISPYFLVLIGALLYKDNVLLSLLFMGIGMVSLLKISTEDIGGFIDWVKSLFGLNRNDDYER